MLESAVLLTTLSTSDEAQIIRIEGEAFQLSGFGLYPGAVIQLRQRFPTFVVKTDETEIALEADVAGRIWVRKLPEEPLRLRVRRRQRRRFGSRNF